MQIQFSIDISGRKRNKWFVFTFLIVNFSLLIFAGYFIAKTAALKPASIIKYFFISLNFIYCLAASVIIMFTRKRSAIIHDHDRKIIAPAIFLIMLIQIIPIIFYSDQQYLALIFILTFFAGNTFLPVYLNYGTLLSAFTDEHKKDLSFDDFCKKYEVSPRETDIVREICNGLSNQEISDKLFISLQTVKDHTHRIYIKTNVKSRVQLINIVKELKIL
jgi:DNA-binding CsgD family transcriptional regulator